MDLKGPLGTYARPDIRITAWIPSMSPIHLPKSVYMAVSKNQGPHFGSPYNKDHNIFGSILGSPIYGSPHIWCRVAVSIAPPPPMVWSPPSPKP